MTRRIIDLDWSRLLGFDQACERGDDVAAQVRTAKIGRKEMGPAIQAKVGRKTMVPPLAAKIGEKGPPGVLGRPQQLAIVKA